MVIFVCCWWTDLSWVTVSNYESVGSWLPARHGLFLSLQFGDQELSVTLWQLSRANWYQVSFTWRPWRTRNLRGCLSKVRVLMVLVNPAVLVSSKGNDWFWLLTDQREVEMICSEPAPSTWWGREVSRTKSSRPRAAEAWELDHRLPVIIMPSTTSRLAATPGRAGQSVTAIL